MMYLITIFLAFKVDRFIRFLFFIFIAILVVHYCFILCCSFYALLLLWCILFLIFVNFLLNCHTWISYWKNWIFVRQFEFFGILICCKNFDIYVLFNLILFYWEDDILLSMNFLRFLPYVFKLLYKFFLFILSYIDLLFTVLYFTFFLFLTSFLLFVILMP